MPDVIHYFETHSTDPAYNLAFEETVLTCRTEGECLLLWQNQNAIVVGQNQNVEAEIDRAFVEAHDIQIVRRMTGGGAVYHDLGNLNYSFITDAGDLERLTMDRFTRPVVDALRALGLNAEASGRNDILVDGKKVSGTAQRLAKGRVLHHGTLLFDSDPEMVAGALRADPEKFRSKSAKSVRSRVGNIRDALPEDMDLPAFWAYLKEAFARDGLLREETLSLEEMGVLEKLKRSKYDSWAWTCGRSPKYDLTNKRRYPGGTLEAGVQVEKGLITGVHFCGDFLSLTPLEPLEEALAGCPFRQEDVGAVLDRFSLRELFGAIGREEVLDVLFHVSEPDCPAP